MATIKIKTTKDFKEKGIYNPDTQVIVSEKTGDEIYLPDVLAELAKDGELISVSIKHEDTSECSLDELQEEQD